MINNVQSILRSDVLNSVSYSLPPRETPYTPGELVRHSSGLATCVVEAWETANDGIAKYAATARPSTFAERWQLLSTEATFARSGIQQQMQTFLRSLLTWEVAMLDADAHPTGPACVLDTGDSLVRTAVCLEPDGTHVWVIRQPLQVVVDGRHTLPVMADTLGLPSAVDLTWRGQSVRACRMSLTSERATLLTQTLPALGSPLVAQLENLWRWEDQELAQALPGPALVLPLPERVYWEIEGVGHAGQTDEIIVSVVLPPAEATALGSHVSQVRLRPALLLAYPSTQAAEELLTERRLVEEYGPDC